MAVDELADIARAFRAGRASGEQLSLAFARATVFCVHSELPGFMAIGEAGSGYVPFYTSPQTLADAEGNSPWFSARAVDLIRLVPDGYGVVVDWGSDTQVVLPAAAFRNQRAGGR
jgi:hypothetical protein